jgi:4a-hydroxytetrahydrobiopterin dehydratase
MTVLTRAERDKALEGLVGWAYDADGDCLIWQHHFADFSEAWGFMARVALVAERHDHHPDWSNVYNRLIVRLRTHSADGVTNKDIDFALEIARLLTVH